MEYYICDTCGVQYEKSTAAPSTCKICVDERQFVNADGQSWTTLQQLVASHEYKNNIVFEEEGIHSITTSPTFGIGQTAYVVRRGDFHLLWDCVTYIDDETVTKIKELGGIHAIALSHPHYYSTQVEWADIFDVPIYIHEDDREWVTRQSERIVYWSGEKLELQQGIILHRLGGHFKGAAVLEWHNAKQEGVVFVGDIIRVAADRRWLTFMYSYPNFIPLPVHIVKRIVQQMETFHFDKLYDAFHRIVEEDAKERIRVSATRYIDALENKLFDT